MQVIDLTAPNDNFKVITFPDGEVHLELLNPIKDGMVDVRCRITSANDLFILMQLSDILKRQAVSVNELKILYLMGMRCDRVFEINRPFTLKVVADVINSMNAKDVSIYEPHSDNSIRLIRNSSTRMLVKEMVRALRFSPTLCRYVSPDYGAYWRYRDDVDFAVKCSKVRETATGKLLDFEVRPENTVRNCNLVVLDDLCDGGGTFVGLAPKLRELNPKSLSLVVAHAVQLDGIKRVAEAYDNVYISNTYKEWKKEEIPSNVKVLNVIG